MDLYTDSIAKWLRYSDFCSVYKKYYDAECDRKPVTLDEWKKEIRRPVDQNVYIAVASAPGYNDTRYEKDLIVGIELENNDNEFYLTLDIKLFKQTVFSDTINNVLNRFCDTRDFEHGIFISDISSFIEFRDFILNNVSLLRTYTSTARCTPLYEYLQKSGFITSYIDMSSRISRPNSFKAKKADVMTVLKEFDNVNVKYDSGGRVHCIKKETGNYSFSYELQVLCGNILNFTFFAYQDDERLFLYAYIEELIKMYSGKKINKMEIDSVDSLREVLTFMIGFLEELACCFDRK